MSAGKRAAVALCARERLGCAVGRFDMCAGDAAGWTGTSRSSCTSALGRGGTSRQGSFAVGWLGARPSRSSPAWTWSSCFISRTRRVCTWNAAWVVRRFRTRRPRSFATGGRSLPRFSRSLGVLCSGGGAVSGGRPRFVSGSFSCSWQPNP